MVSLSARKSIEKVLEKVQGKCKTNLITYDNIKDSLEILEHKFYKNYGIYKKDLEGISVIVNWHSYSTYKHQSNYKKQIKSTFFEAGYFDGKWRLSAIFRHEVSSNLIKIEFMPEELKEKIFDSICNGNI